MSEQLLKFLHFHPFFVVYPLEGVRFLYIFGDPGLLCGGVAVIAAAGDAEHHQK